MMRFVWRLIRLLVVLVVLGAVIYFWGSSVLAAAGRYLVTEQLLSKADAILILSGEPVLRVPEGARLYHEGYASKILLSREPKLPGLDELARTGIQVPESQEFSVKLLEQLRVPRKAILTIPERSDSTRSEMLTVAHFLNANPVKSMIIVTSKSHTTRAYKIFSTGLGRRVRLIMHPVPYDPFNPERWWHDRRDAKEVLHEYQALADYWRIRLWSMLTGESAAPSAITVR